MLTNFIDKLDADSKKLDEKFRGKSALDVVNKDHDLLALWNNEQPFTHIKFLAKACDIAIEGSKSINVAAIDHAWQESKIEDELKKWIKERQENKKAFFLEIAFLAMNVLPTALYASSIALVAKHAVNYITKSEPSMSSGEKSALANAMKSFFNSTLSTIKGEVKDHFKKDLNVDRYFKEQKAILQFTYMMKAKLFENSIKLSININSLMGSPKLSENVKILYLFSILKVFVNPKNDTKLTRISFEQRAKEMRSLFFKFKQIVFKIGVHRKGDAKAEMYFIGKYKGKHYFLKGGLTFLGAGDHGVLEGYLALKHNRLQFIEFYMEIDSRIFPFAEAKHNSTFGAEGGFEYGVMHVNREYENHQNAKFDTLQLI